MFGAVFLALVVMSASVCDVRANDDVSHPSDDYGPTLEDVKDLLDAVEQEKVELFEDLAVLSTFCASAASTVSYLQNVFIPQVQFIQEKSNDVANEYRRQVKALHCRVVTAIGSVIEARSLAMSVQDPLEKQMQKLNETDELDMEHEADETELQNSYNAFITSRSVTYPALIASSFDPMFAFVMGLLSDSTEAVNNRKCEHGYGVFGPGEHDVAFTTNFTQRPEVALQVVGFSSHLDVHTYDDRDYYSVDVLGIDKFVDYINNEGFGVVLKDNTEGAVILKSVACSWSACEGMGPPPV